MITARSTGMLPARVCCRARHSVSGGPIALGVRAVTSLYVRVMNGGIVPASVYLHDSSGNSGSTVLMRYSRSGEYLPAITGNAGGTRSVYPRAGFVGATWVIYRDCSAERHFKGMLGAVIQGAFHCWLTRNGPGAIFACIGKGSLLMTRAARFRKVSR